MNKNKIIEEILSNAVFAFITTLFIVVFYDMYDIIQIIVMFIGSFMFLSVWFWFFEKMKPVKITKELDEDIHPTTQNEVILHVSYLKKHYGNKLNLKSVEKCDNCGSTLFRIYNENTEKGTYIQFICAKCNQKATGLEFNWKTTKGLNSFKYLYSIIN